MKKIDSDGNEVEVDDSYRKKDYQKEIETIEQDDDTSISTAVLITTTIL